MCKQSKSKRIGIAPIPMLQNEPNFQMSYEYNILHALEGHIRKMMSNRRCGLYFQLGTTTVPLQSFVDAHSSFCNLTIHLNKIPSLT